MGKCFVSFSHSVSIVTSLDGTTVAVDSVHDLTGESLCHCAFTSCTCKVDQPSESESLTACRSYFHRNLVCCTTDSACLDF